MAKGSTRSTHTSTSGIGTQHNPPPPFQKMQPTQSNNQQMQPSQYNQQIQPNNQQMQPMVNQTPYPGGNPNLANKLFANAPKYLIQRILANIHVIHSLMTGLITGGNLDLIQVKQLLTNEIHKLTENLNHPALEDAIKKLTDVADKPVTLFINKLMEIIQRHVDDIVYKVGSLAFNIIGGVPVFGAFSNALAAGSNIMHIAKNVTDLGENLFENVSKFKTDMEDIVREFDPSIPNIGQQYGIQPFLQPGMQQYGQPGMQTFLQPSMQPGMQQYGQLGVQSFLQPGMKPGVQSFLQPSMQPGMQPGAQQYGQQNFKGGSKLNTYHNVKEAKKHLHHLHRKKNRTLKRIHHSIHQFLSSNHNKRSIKAKIKVTH